KRTNSQANFRDRSRIGASDDLDEFTENRMSFQWIETPDPVPVQRFSLWQLAQVSFMDTSVWRVLAGSFASAAETRSPACVFNWPAKVTKLGLWPDANLSRAVAEVAWIIRPASAIEPNSASVNAA